MKLFKFFVYSNLVYMMFISFSYAQECFPPVGKLGYDICAGQQINQQDIEDCRNCCQLYACESSVFCGPVCHKCRVYNNCSL